MKKHIQTFLYSLSLFSSLFFTQEAKAKLSFRDFKNVTRHFKEGKKYNSPTLGQALLESGVIDDIRFNWDFENGYKEGRREYVQDTSQDPVWNLTKLLFPSPSGALAVTTSAPSNFGNNVTSPETVSILMNFANNVRQREDTFRKQMQRQMKKNNLKSEEDYYAWAEENGVKKNLFSKKELDQLTALLFKSMGKDKATEKEKTDLRKNGITPILNAIQGSIAEELKPDSIYPHHFTEQIITAFLAERFNTEDDILTFMRHCDDDIVDKSNLPEKLEKLEEDEIEVIAKKEQMDYDDYYALANVNSLTTTTPYKPGQTPVSAEKAYAFNRKTGTLDLQDFFADCGETALRHLINLLLYDPESKTFQWKKLKERFDEIENPYIGNLFKFYEKQNPDDSNNEHIDFRALWNTVVGDLNALNGSPHKILYRTGTNNIVSGFINAIRVFEKVFDLKLTPYPQSSDLNEKAEWVKNSFLELCKTVNPYREYKVEFLTPKEEVGELTGTLKVTVSAPLKEGQVESQGLFSFLYNGSVIHMGIGQIENLASTKAMDFNEILTQKMKFHSQNESEDALWLLTPENLAKEHLHTPLFQLLSQKINDAESRIAFIKKTSENFEELKAHSYFSKITRSLSHVLADMAWDDAFVIEKASPLILPFLEIPELRNVLSEKIKTLNLSKSQIKEIRGLKHLKKLENLNLDDTPNLKFLSLVGLENLRSLQLKNSAISKIEGLETLKTFLKVQMVGAKNLNLEDFPSTTIGLVMSPPTLENFNDFLREKFPNLHFLSFIDPADQSHSPLEVKNNPSIKTLMFHGVFQHISLEEMHELTSIHFHKNIEKVSLNNIPKIRNLNFKDIEKLRELSVMSLKNLNDLTLENTTDLQKLQLNNLEKVRKIDLTGSSVKTIEGLDHENLPQLNELILQGTTQLEEVHLELMSQVQVINLNSSSLYKADIENLEQLRFLNLAGTRNLEEVTLKNLNKLTEFNLKNSHVRRLTLENMDSLQLLDLTNLPHLEQIVFKGSFKKLNTFWVNGSKNLKSIEGLENLTNLDNMEARGSGLPRQKIKGLRSGASLSADDWNELGE